MAVEVLRKASCFEEALHLSKKHGLYASYLRMQIEDRQNYREALEYIQQLPGELASSALQLYGKDLITPNRGNDVVFDRSMYTEF